MRTVRTEIVLPFTARHVWDVLTDFECYSNWNPLNIEAHGVAKVGEQITMTFVNPMRPSATVTQRVVVTDATPMKRLAWCGHIPMLFRGEHFFELTDLGAKTRLLHGEYISGLFALTIGNRTIAESFIPRYVAMNEALGSRLASLH